MALLSLETILQALEREPEEQGDRRSEAVQLKLYWRAQAVKRGLHGPGESSLELAGGSGLVAVRLQRLLGAENPNRIFPLFPKPRDGAQAAVGGP